MKKKLLFSLIFLSLLCGITQAQVTVGAEEPAEAGALLQIKEFKDVALDGANSNRGLELPRVTLSDKKQLYPMFLSDPTDPASGPNSNYTSNKITLDKTHTGLIVYNLVENEDLELCLGLNQWDGEQWTCFQQKPSNAQFTIDCSSIKVMGDYGDGIALNTSNYIRLSVNVTRIGAYSISATSNPDNGYFFETSATFYSTGIFTLTIPGTGQPVNHTQGSDLVDPSDDTPDQFSLTSSGGGEDCSFSINVRSTAAQPEFTIDCSATVVQGTYFEDVALSSTPSSINGEPNRIKVTLKDIPTSAFGAIAILQTNEVDGFSFSGQAVLTSSTQEVYLEGTGIPRGLNDKTFTITSNSVSSSGSCTATVYMLIPRKRLMTLGNMTLPYRYNAGLTDDRNPGNSLNTLLTDSDNFGYNQWSILKFAGFKNQGTAYDSNFIPYGSTAQVANWVDDNRDIVALNTYTWQYMTANKLEELLMGTGSQPKIDIFMIGYDTPFFRTGYSDDAAKCQKLINFVKSGGILMICSEASESNGNFMNLFFNSPSPAITSVGGASAGSNYTLGFNSENTPASMKPYYCKDNDPILAGPFEDIVGRNWGEDASQTMYLSNLPLDQIVVYSGARPIGNTSLSGTGVTIFRHKEYPLVFIGDGGFNSSESRTTYWNITDNICPFVLTNKTIKGRTYKNYPSFRYNFGGAGNYVYNSVFTANAFAWCIQKAEELRKANNL